jgi:hypothetical protein
MERRLIPPLPREFFYSKVYQTRSVNNIQVGCNMKKFLVCLCSVLWLSGCATTAKYEANLNSWVGNDANNLFNSWGYPAYSFDAPNGNKVYVYESKRNYTMPTYPNSSHSVYYWCKTFFEVDSSNRIVRWRWEGNYCKASKASKARYEIDIQ